MKFLEKHDIKKLKRQFAAFLVLATILEFTNVGPVVLRYAGFEELAQRTEVPKVHAAFPQVAGYATSSRASNANDDSVTLPSGITAGDLILVFHFSDGTSTRTWPGSWVEIKDATSTGPSSVGIAYLIASGGETNVTATKNISEQFTAITVRIPASSWHGTTPPEVSAGATGSNTRPNPDTVTPSWGTEDTLFIAVAHIDESAGGGSVSIWPTGYAENQITSPNISSAGRGAIATRGIAMPLSDPDRFTWSASDQWWAGTIAVRPASSDGGDACSASWSNGYTYCRTITVDYARVSSTLTDFPLLVSSTIADWKHTAYGGDITDVDGDDLVFASNATGSTLLSFEREKYVSSTGEAYYWVKIPSLSNATHTLIYAFYGNSSVTSFQSTASDVWDSNYKGVWHLAETSGTTSTDSTSNAKHGIKTSSSSPNPSLGKIGGAQLFDDSTSRIRASSTGEGTSTLTISAWWWRTDTANTDRIAGHASGSVNGWWWSQGGGNTSPFFRGTGNTDNHQGWDGDVPVGQWNYLVSTFDGVGGFQRHFIGPCCNGEESDFKSTTTSTILTTTADFTIGASLTTDYFDGYIDEVRISNIVRSPQWIKTEWNNQSSPSTFYAMGSEQTSGGGGEPNVASFTNDTDSTLTDGGRSGHSITLTGTNFGTASAGSRATCGGGAGTGCIHFDTNGSTTVADASISAWTNTSITFTVSSTLATLGGTSSLTVYAAGTPDATPNTFYVYPNITGMAVCTDCTANAAREYGASDTDGLIMLQGDHFSSSTASTGTVTIFGSTATAHGTMEGACTVAGYMSSTICLEVPTAISNSVYTGTVTSTRASDNKADAISFRILPRITSNSPNSSGTTALVQINGDHFCQSGTCPGTTPIAFVQNASTTNNSAGTTLSKRFPSNVTASNTIVVFGGAGGNAGALNTPTDNLGNTYTLAATFRRGTSEYVGIWYVKDAIGGAVTTTITTNVSEDIHLHIYEISGLDNASPLDRVASSTGSGKSRTVSTTVATTVDDEYVFAGFYENSGQSTYTADPAYSNPATSINVGIDTQFTEGRIVSSTGVQTARATSSNNTAWSGLIATFKAASSNGFASASDNVKFGSTTSTDSDFQSLTGGAGACNGAGAAWAHTEICVKVPTATPAGSAPTIITSNTLYLSNTMAFTVTGGVSTRSRFIGPGISR